MIDRIVIGAALLTCAAGAWWAGPVWPQAAGDTLVISGSTVTLRPSKRPGAVGEVFFRNVQTNSGADDGGYGLRMGGLSVGVTFVWNVDGHSDAILLTPPEGVVCVPSCDVALAEGFDGVIVLYSLEGVGS